MLRAAAGWPLRASPPERRPCGPVRPAAQRLPEPLLPGSRTAGVRCGVSVPQRAPCSCFFHIPVSGWTCEPSQKLVRRDRQLADARAGGVEDGISNSRWDADLGDLADALDAERIDVRVVLL